MHKGFKCLDISTGRVYIQEMLCLMRRFFRSQSFISMTEQNGAAGSSADASGSGSGSSAPVSPVDASTQAASQESLRPRTRLQAGVRRPKVYIDDTIRYGFLTSTGEPHTVEEALGDKNWKEAMDVDYNALIKNNT
jgi:hypothetical protein